MLTISTPAPNRVDLRLSGALNADQMREGLDALIGASKDVSNGRMLYVIDDFQWPDATAILVEMGRLPALMQLAWKYRRIAVVAGENWIRTIAQIEGALMPGVAIKGFPPDQANEAERWLDG